MEEFKLIKAGGLKDNTKLYRYMKLSQFMELIEKEQIYLTNIKYWEDTWEAPTSFLKDGAFESSENRNPYLERLIGQCWSLEGVSDALWRIYSTEKEGILIQTTVKKFEMIEGIKKAMIAPVIYYNDLTRTVQKLKKIKYYDGIFGEGFLKRKAFEHEKEVRIITINDKQYVDREYENTMHIEFKVDPRKFIEGITIDPRASRWYVETIKKYCRRAKLETEPVKSDLYCPVDSGLSKRLQDINST